MTHTDILRASLLDILFERRNKQYGAYVLRKFYARRLSLALCSTLGLVVAAGLLASALRPAGAAGSAIEIHDSVL
ncbi:MAG: energy transducer TonB, partial [Chitinophagaceae bacterium]